MSKDKDNNNGKPFDEHTSPDHTSFSAGEDVAVVYEDADIDAMRCDAALLDDTTGEDLAAAHELHARRPDSRQMGATSRRLRAPATTPLRHRASLDWRQDQQRVTAPQGHSKEKVISLAALTDALMQSRTFQSLHDKLSADGLSVVYDEQTALSQYYPRSENGALRHVIALNPHHPRGDLLNMLAREVRRAWQNAEGALVNPLTFEPDEAILVNRAQQADVLMISIKIAWELKLAGENEAWDYLVGSPMADVSRMFEGKARDDFRTLNNGEAARAAYDKFFEGSRTKLHDKRIIHQMLLDETGYIKGRQQRPQVSMELFQRLGQLPSGRNYLAMSAERLPTDPCYATVEDRSNANFLWFIKFERSFQEKELEMVKQSVDMSAEVVDMASWLRQRKGAARVEVEA